jgi:SAM-dependent methyltransferase
MNFHTALFVVGSVLLLEAIVIAALWALAKRIRAWKEQILRAVSIVESNSAHAHDVTRTMAWKNREAFGAEMARLRGEVSAAASENREALGAEVAALRNEVSALREQGEFRTLVRKHAAHQRTTERGKSPSRYDEILRFLNSLDHANDASRAYLEIHRHRIARTVDLVPQPGQASRALELGAYLYMAAALKCVLGYAEVRGAYQGESGAKVVRTVESGTQEIFSYTVDMFNVETDVFPYPDQHFDVVLACEVIEHLLWDPAQMLLECSRVLAAGGALVLTTPNIASLTSVHRVLAGETNPQVYSHYPAAHIEMPHIREYTASELEDLLTCCGFRIEYLFTEPIGAGGGSEWISRMLDDLGFPTEFRGEQIYCVARKCAGAKLTRRPQFLYEEWIDHGENPA